MPLGDGEDQGFPLAPQLSLKRCPHCAVANPSVPQVSNFPVTPGRFASMKGRGTGLHWYQFACQTCGGVISCACLKKADGGFVVAPGSGPKFVWIVPTPRTIASVLPARVAYYLGQAQETLTSPSASVVMSAAAVDAMMKDKGYKEGSLHSRIEKAAQDGLITKAMAAVAHDVRLDANNERHVDENASPPTDEDAHRCFDFADALADLIFVLPTRVKRPQTRP
jgi:hypothetical protein